MGWQSDWLYQCVFDLVKNVWRKAERETRSLPPPHQMPDYLLVIEYAKADSEQALCVQPELQMWKYDGIQFVPLYGEESLYYLNLEPGIRGMYYSQGMIGFHIARDRRKVVLNTCLGPRFGRGLVYRVRGQGEFGRLEPYEGAIGWIS